MYRIWCERPLPSDYASMIDGVAEAVAAGRDTPISTLPGCDAILASVGLTYDGALMDQAPALKVISRVGIGLDNVNVPDATARRIVVCNTPDAPTVSTAEHALALLFAVTKNICQADRASRAGTTDAFFEHYLGLELQGQCLGLVGLGRIGGYVAKVALALGMDVIGFDPYAQAERAAALGIQPAPTLEALLRAADIVSLHVPVTPETRLLINAERLAQMKPGAILINGARGWLVDEQALLDALQRGRLRGAGLDVFQQEPPDPNHPLLHLDNVVVTPHISSTTAASRERLWRTAIAQTVQVLSGERPPHLVNPEIWNSRRQ